MLYSVVLLDETKFDAPCSKVVCVGRNYAEHARELNNPIPSSPILFIKPESSIQDQSILKIPRDGIHYETELAILIGEPGLSGSGRVKPEIAGIGLALDLTDRELQSQLKERSHPWERAKAFDGAAYLTRFIRFDNQNLANIRFSLNLNGDTVQLGASSDMLFDIETLLTEIATTFTLRKGDVVLTGTPKGVGTLKNNDTLLLRLECGSSEHDFDPIRVATRGV
ncbi:hypothetical protein A3758_07200 [Oleiphilus sp. HI0118]|nr:hypothetical protein A3758_07200 [Oleiphilus sp. HI0118]